MSRYPLLAPSLALAAGALALLACGKRGDPLPPLRRTPQAVTELELAQRGSSLEIRIQAPRATTEGERLGVVTLQILSAQGDAPLGKSAARREEKAAPGERLVITAPLPSPGTLVRVAAIATSSSRSSTQSAPRLLKVADLVPPPRDLAAELEPEGVRLRFRAPDPMPAWIEPPKAAPASRPAGAEPVSSSAEAERPASALGATGEPSVQDAEEPPVPDATPAPPRAAAFNVYRRTEPGAHAAPLNAEPVSEPTYLDASAPLLSEVCYEVRTVVSAGPLIESEATPETCLRVLDKKAPAAPTGVATLPVADGVEVSWSPSTEPDLAAYRVYRRARGEAPVLMVELKAGETSAVDRDAGLGQRFQYHVTAVDAAGNESLASTPVEGVRR
jgi:hypothetical protein